MILFGLVAALTFEACCISHLFLRVAYLEDAREAEVEDERAEAEGLL